MQWIDIDTGIEKTGISRRAKNALMATGRAETLRDLLRMRYEDVMVLPNMGLVTLKGIEGFLAGYGLRLGMKEEEIERYGEAVDAIRMPRMLYISCPFRSELDGDGKAVRHLADGLRQKGYDVYNPLDNGLSGSDNAERHVRANIRALTGCDRVLFMPGWERSAACQAEYLVATMMGLSVYFDVNGL